MSDEYNARSNCIDFQQFRVTRVNDIIHAEARALLNYWETLRHGRATPLRSEVDPREMLCSVRNLFILEDLGKRNIRFRLAGTEIVQALDLELRGMSARVIMEADGRESLIELLSEVLQEPGIGYFRLNSTALTGEKWEMLALPLRSDSGRIDRLLGCLHCLETVDRIGVRTPLKLSIDQAKITPIVITNREDTPPATGFAENPMRFAGKSDDPELVRASLTAIQGGLSESAGLSRTDPGSKASHLKLVKDD